MSESIEEQIQRLLGRPWSSYEELRGALRKVGVREGYFDCFEEWKPGTVIILKKSVGDLDQGFVFNVELQSVTMAA